MSYSNGPKMVTSGLVFCADAANVKSYTSGSTIWRDLSANARTGSLINGPTYSTSSLGSITFDGTNDYVSFGNILDNIPSMTICSWFNVLAPFSSSKYITIFKKCNDIFAGAGWALYAFRPSTISTSFQTLVMCQSDGGYEFNQPTTTSVFSLNTWLYMCGRVNTFNSIDVFMNGIKQGIGPFQAGTITSISSTAIVDVARDDASGGNLVYGNMRTGMLQLYNRALTDAEILQNYNATKGRFGL
jgi:hypothetical protein